MNWTQTSIHTHLVVQAIWHMVVVERVIMSTQVQPLLHLTAEGGEVGVEGAGCLMLAVLQAQLPAAYRRVIERVRALFLQVLFVVLCFTGKTKTPQDFRSK